MKHANDFILRIDIRLGAVRVTKRLQKLFTSDCSSPLIVLPQRHFGSLQADFNE